MARQGFLYNGPLPDLVDEYPNVEVGALPIVLRFAGHGCAKVQVLVHPPIDADGKPCCEARVLDARWADLIVDCEKSVLQRCNNQIVLSTPGTYRVEVCKPQVDTVVYWEESEKLRYAATPIIIQ